MNPFQLILAAGVAAKFFGKTVVDKARALGDLQPGRVRADCTQHGESGNRYVGNRDKKYAPSAKQGRCFVNQINPLNLANGKQVEDRNSRTIRPLRQPFPMLELPRTSPRAGNPSGRGSR